MDDIPWLPLAMVFIAFLSWLRNRIKETSQIRRARNAERAEVARARRTTAPAKEAYQTPYRDKPAREFVEEGPKSFRELFDEINAQKAAEAVPPPLPSPVARAVVEPEEEEEAWGDGDGFGVASMPELSSVPRKPLKPAVKKEKNILAKTLSNGTRLRNALILKEILGPPKALSKHPRRP